MPGSEGRVGAEAGSKSHKSIQFGVFQQNNTIADRNRGRTLCEDDPSPTGEEDALSARTEYGGRAGEIWRISEEMVMSDELDTYCVLRSDRDLSPE